MGLSKLRGKNDTLDVLHGPLLVKMFTYAVPIFLSGVLQQAFTTADSLVIGNFCGPLALGGVSATATIINLLVNFFMGLSSGAAVAIAQHLGAGDDEGAGKHAHNAIATALVCGVFIAVVGNIFAKDFLRLLKTPEEIIPYSEKYIRIYFSGVPFILLYNYGSAIMRTVGDTKRPLFYLFIGGAANVVLNLIFVIVFNMDTDGVAIATIISNIISASLVMFNLTHSSHPCRIRIKSVRLMKKEFLKITAIGLPTGVQSAVFALSNMVMQSSINSFGASAVAGNAAATNVDIYANYVGDAYVQTTLTFAGQNFGAGNYKRMKKICLYGVLSVITICCVLSLFIVIFAVPLSRFFIKGDDYAVMVSCTKMYYVGGFYAICSAMGVVSANIRATGKSVISMIGTVIGVCVLRVVWVYTVFAMNPKSLETLFLIYPISWLVTFLFHISTYTIVYHRMKSGKLKYATQR